MTLNKTTVYTPKEALDADPDWTIPVKLGRGRMPKGGDEHVRALVAKGYNIKGYSSSTPAATATTEVSAPVIRKEKPGNVKVIQDYVLFWPMGEYVAKFNGKVLPGKSKGMAEVCNNCRVSLVQCHCGKPMITGDRLVSIVRA